ncbi:NAD(P)-dependent dehydrogenase (short-subunit alcohol dehydrogenase family) [Herbihabitans rhizosphaerae]|uniref:NAD(P)-dependent dehydrogenase (Short-subunit alcohol dehydrogenase family) n=1 Tax=Herbihabitans rhizosphaerae TaxID=1872711 RepID=A0A4Q7KDA7_9PSEU|nr:SDR family NAD(P)-dependent oxidoreductase [Herbihabitans rhizosphaerae]RZS31157.1 NAD(P)-dependent dehydrogenase (short-subunit alcohol dehydrogenase family) [Herbihabitans rhizosphaerae]
MSSIALVTGASSGIGFETARRLAGEGRTVIMHTRTHDDGVATVRRLGAAGVDPALLDFAVADFTRLHEVVTMVDEIVERYQRIDLLVNNAGIAGPDARTLTEDGNEVTLQVNYLAAFLLTRLLDEPLRRAGNARVINVSSSLHKGGDIDWTDINRRQRYLRGAAYAQSKLALTVFTTAFARGTAGARTAISVHPGVVDTAVLRAYGHRGRPVGAAADVIAHLASPNTTVRNGGYYDERVLGTPSPVVLDSRAGDRLWKLSERLITAPVA